MQENYGKSDPACVDKVKALYIELDLEVALNVCYQIIFSKYLLSFLLHLMYPISAYVTMNAVYLNVPFSLF